MNQTSYGYCKTFVKDAEPTPVLARLAGLLGGEVQRRSLVLPGIVLDVRANPDADQNAGDDFVRWPVVIEAEPDDPHGDPAMVQVMTRIITDLWDAGHPAVAACDFEEELPWRGGIRRVSAWGGPGPLPTRLCSGSAAAPARSGRRVGWHRRVERGWSR